MMKATYHTNRNQPGVRELLAAGAPGFNGQRVQIEPTANVELYGTLWDEGHRNVYCILDLVTRQPIHISGAPYGRPSMMHDRPLTMAPGLAVVCWHQGPCESVTVYLHPDDQLGSGSRPGRSTKGRNETMNTTKQNRSKELRQQIDDRVDVLAKAVDDIRASEAFKDYLDVQARFHRYSWHNSMLILMQRPDATQVAGFRAWKKLGRHVCKGEHGIGILAPCPFKRSETDPETGEETEHSGIYFKVVSVFDLAQTDGEPLPTVDVPDVAETADTLRGDLERVATGRGIVVSYVSTRAGLYGVSHGGTIDIATGHASGQQAKTLAHELAHESLHHKDRGDFTRSMAELEAESVAYVVCAHFGLNVEVRASRYIALWNGDAKALRASLDRIADTARAIIDDVAGLAGRKAVA